MYCLLEPKEDKWISQNAILFSFWHFWERLRGKSKAKEVNLHPVHHLFAHNLIFVLSLRSFVCPCWIVSVTWNERLVGKTSAFSWHPQSYYFPASLLPLLLPEPQRYCCVQRLPATRLPLHKTHYTSGHSCAGMHTHKLSIKHTFHRHINSSHVHTTGNISTRILSPGVPFPSAGCSR